MFRRHTHFVCSNCGDSRTDALAVCPRCGGSYREHVAIETGDSAKVSDSEEVVGHESSGLTESLHFKSFEDMRSTSALGSRFGGAHIARSDRLRQAQ